ncbi:WD40 repeat-like protein [Coniochaeta ligniaria NRRL 30616]|uniref:WD40 repeat-like protein n=1 Tax=Coniochaeta ligniaria NRRL 30616 TaxID=1408157 RepID=A0A1J7IJT9_9PEZI|nr:WD40 repeat-like protein [Coniochaeta ligniaria NRRL 30616]
MGLTLTASYSHRGPSGEPPQKKLRAEVIERLATATTAELAAELRHESALPPTLEAQLAYKADSFLRTGPQGQRLNGSTAHASSLPSRVETPVPVPHLPSYLPPRLTPASVPTPTPNFGSATNPSQDNLRVESPVPIPSYSSFDSGAFPEKAFRDKQLPYVTTNAPRFSNSPVPLPSFAKPASDPQASSRIVTTNEVNRQQSFLYDTPPTPVVALRKKSQLNVTSPQNFRTRAHALAWRKDGETSDSTEERPSWASLTSRPYKTAAWRREIVSGTRKLVRLHQDDLKEPQICHVDFAVEEIQDLLKLVRVKMGLGRARVVKGARRELMDLLKDNYDQVSQAVLRLPQNPLRGRTIDDIKSYLYDLSKELTKKRTRATKDSVILYLERDDYDRQGAIARSSRVDSLLLAREIAGQRGYGSMRRLENFTNEFRKCLEDGLELRADWDDCAGDIATITWVSNDGFICGTTEHSDAHNQQYNKENNLVLGSCSRGTLKAYADHRIIRPIIEKGENSSEAMRQSQSPWLYTSVVSSDYDERYDRAYTCGFDRTVKIWKAEKSGSSMSLLGTWPHDGNVNFVVASKHESGMVATAADVAADAVRIYHVDDYNVSGSRFHSYSCSRVVDLEGNTVSTDKWAYFPAAIRWGRCADVQHLVAVGYSPRSRTQDDNDIPEDRRGTGEICVWNGLTGERWNIISGSKLNVFEIVWHPTQPCFIAATSPQGLHGVELDARVRTQVRVFAISPAPEYNGKAFYVHQALDCSAIDINELTIMPNSSIYCYVTAGCTDGKTYVWDTAQGDKPIHVLEHGKPIEELHGEREKEDIGVKFCAWGTTPDRFYTGSSDGVVKVWNIRSRGKPRVRDLLEVPAPVSFGQFSPDMSKLVIGDASGRVSFLSVDENEQKPAQVLSLASLGLLSGKRKIRRPQPVIRHPEPDPPAIHRKEHDDEKGIARARAYLQKGQITLTGNPVVGAVQGPNYAETGLYRKELHADDDPTQPLLASQNSLQQDAVWRPKFERRAQQLRPLRENSKLPDRHVENLGKDLDLAQLSEETKEELRLAGALVEMDYDFEYEDDIESQEDEDFGDRGSEDDLSESHSEAGSDLRALD